MKIRHAVAIVSGAILPAGATRSDRPLPRNRRNGWQAPDNLVSNGSRF